MYCYSNAIRLGHKATTFPKLRTNRPRFVSGLISNHKTTVRFRTGSCCGITPRCLWGRYLTWFVHHQPSRRTGARCWTIGAVLCSSDPKACPAPDRPPSGPPVPRKCRSNRRRSRSPRNCRRPSSSDRRPQTVWRLAPELLLPR